MNIVDLASQANFAINTQNHRTASDCLGALYTSIQRDSDLLLDLPASSCQAVGLALTGMALLYNWNDDDINSVAAENAYYCLAKSYLETDNTFCLPAIFTTLQKRPNLLKDKFIAYWSEQAQKEIGMPIGMALGGNPFNAPHLQGFRDQALSHKIYVQQFTLSKFYDETSEEFTIPTDMPYYIPRKNDIQLFLSARTELSDFFDIEKCKKVFKLIFDECKDSLERFRF